MVWRLIVAWGLGCCVVYIVCCDSLSRRWVSIRTVNDFLEGHCLPFFFADPIVNGLEVDCRVGFGCCVEFCCRVWQSKVQMSKIEINLQMKMKRLHAISHLFSTAPLRREYIFERRDGGWGWVIVWVVVWWVEPRSIGGFETCRGKIKTSQAKHK